MEKICWNLYLFSTTTRLFKSQNLFFTNLFHLFVVTNFAVFTFKFPFLILSSLPFDSANNHSFVHILPILFQRNLDSFPLFFFVYDLLLFSNSKSFELIFCLFFHLPLFLFDLFVCGFVWKGRFAISFIFFLLHWLLLIIFICSFVLVFTELHLTCSFSYFNPK